LCQTQTDTDRHRPMASNRGCIWHRAVKTSRGRSSGNYSSPTKQKGAKMPRMHRDAFGGRAAATVRSEADLRVDSEQDKHEEEERCPELWRLQVRHYFRVSDKRQAGTCQHRGTSNKSLRPRSGAAPWCVSSTVCRHACRVIITGLTRQDADCEGK